MNGNQDLIVLGSHNRSALGRLFLGSVSQTVLTEARCSVRIARARLAKEPSPLQFLIGVEKRRDYMRAYYNEREGDQLANLIFAPDPLSRFRYEHVHGAQKSPIPPEIRALMFAVLEDGIACF